MQDNPFPAAERILADIESIFKKDPKLSEFDIVPVNENQNKSPVLHASHSLGLESWCVRHVFCFIYQRLMDIRKKRAREEPGILTRLLRGALLLNPDVASFWNMRKDLVLSSHVDPSADLHLSAIVLSHKPKCSEAFIHRRWIISHFLLPSSSTKQIEPLENRMSPLGTLSQVLDGELKVSALAASRYANNYNAWNHRIWSVQNVCPSGSLWSLLLREWCQTGQWVACHVSDHSGMQYRQFLLDRMMVISSEGEEESVLDSARSQGSSFVAVLVKALSNFRETPGDNFASISEDGGSEGHMCENLLRLAIGELLFNTDLICQFVGHEALWCHRRFVVRIVMRLNNDWVRVVCGEDLADELTKALQAQEQLLVNHCTLHLHSDVHQVRFAKRHCLWLGRILNISVSCECN
ncbi:protein prenyltransferase alpha subunit repeat-containing protein 1 [Ischnura elegans]|uniref:protein prenyltransferase alpha subunit repeat-containing protein 1 n=1 Tax=Ischnura elegans TaxID=197161 RepID=UPI001ED8B15D|nr:protein prenyltransferase alpha subunit repeat-containing protein 1 [Ischnura elegans]